MVGGGDRGLGMIDEDKVMDAARREFIRMMKAPIADTLAATCFAAIKEIVRQMNEPAPPK